MIIENFKIECAKRNIKTAAGLHDCMKREINSTYQYETIRALWNGKGKLVTLQDACKAVGVKSIKFAIESY